MRSEPPKPLTERQAARLARVVATTRRLLSKRSAEDLRMEDIARASRVAAGTLYNRFGTKNGLISAALLDYFDEAVGALVADRRNGTAVQMLQYGLDVTVRAILQAPNFSRALMATYFRPGTEHEATDRLTQRVFDTFLPILQHMHQQQQLARWVSVSLLDNEICDRLFGVVVKWAQGKIRDDELEARLRLAVLLILRGASVGKQAAEIDTLLTPLNVRLAP